MTTGVEIALQERLVHVELQPDLIQILLILCGRGRAEAHAVAEIIGRQTRHHRVEIEHALGAAGLRVKQDVVELGVVVRHAQRQLAGREHAAERPELLLPREQEVDLGPDILHAAADIGFDGGAELAQAVDGVVEMRDGLIQGGRREIRQRLLELAEGHRGLVKVVSVARHIQADAAGDEVVGAPELALVIDAVFSAVLGPAEADALQTNLLAVDEPGDRVDILDQLLRVAEGDAVDPLQGVGLPVVADDAEGAVDMAVAERLTGDGRSVQAELL